MATWSGWSKPYGDSRAMAVGVDAWISSSSDTEVYITCLLYTSVRCDGSSFVWCDHCATWRTRLNSRTGWCRICTMREQLRGRCLLYTSRCV